MESTYPSVLEASNAAVKFGNTLQGQALGYIVRLQLAHDEDETTTLYTKVF
ncbi:MAG: hypothetical protein ABIR16_02350 [Dokdonella sp.]